MATITFDKGEYKAGETATITYVDAPSDGKIYLVYPDRRGMFLVKAPGSGTATWLIPTDAMLGQYKVELWTRSGSGGIIASDTMIVVSGVPSTPPPDEGETRELDIGDYEVTWTMSGYGTLKAEITVTDTGVTCHSVTGGACYSATPPGVTISAFTVTAYLKSAVTPPTKGYLTVNTSPTGASVKVGTVSCGTTPVTACALSPGWKEIILTKSGYKTRVLMEEIKAGQTLNLGTITLTPTAAPPTPPDAAKFGLSEIVENHLPEWISGYACAGCSGRYEYKCPAGYKRTECVPQAGGTHGCCARCLVAFVKCEQEGVTPPEKAYLTVTTSPTGALVKVNGVSCGTTPVTRCALSPGSYQLTITKSGYETVKRGIGIDVGEMDMGTITLTPTGVPPVGIGSWIDESGVTNLTPSHAMYVYYLSQGATGAADTKYAGLSPKPSRMDPSIATVDNAMGIFYYSQGAMGAGNTKTGLNY